MEIFIWNVTPGKQQLGEEAEFKRMGWVRANKNNWCVVSRGSYRRRGEEKWVLWNGLRNCGEAVCNLIMGVFTSTGPLSSFIRQELPISMTHLWLKTNKNQTIKHWRYKLSTKTISVLPCDWNAAAGSVNQGGRKLQECLECDPHFGERKRNFYFPGERRCTQQDVLILLSFKVALIREGSLKAVRDGNC